MKDEHPWDLLLSTMVETKNDLKAEMKSMRTEMASRESVDTINQRLNSHINATRWVIGLAVPVLAGVAGTFLGR